MGSEGRIESFDRARFLAEVIPASRALASSLCIVLEAVFPRRNIVLYAGFPMAVRHGRWIAGFGIQSRSGAIVLYLSTAAARALMPRAARRLGRGGFQLTPGRRLSAAQIVATARRAFAAAKRDGVNGRVIDGRSAAPRANGNGTHGSLNGKANGKVNRRASATQSGKAPATTHGKTHANAQGVRRGRKLAGPDARPHAKPRGKGHATPNANPQQGKRVSGTRARLTPGRAAPRRRRAPLDRA